MRKNLGIIAVLVVFTALILGCPSAAGPAGGGDITVPVTGVTLTNTGRMTLEMGGTLTLAATMAPANANTGLTWTSSDATIATVSQAGVVTPVAVNAAPATITVVSTADPTILSTCTVYVIATGTAVNTNSWKLVNLAAVTADTPLPATTTTVVPPFINGMLMLTNGSTSGGVAAAGITNSTMLYFDTPLTADFVFRARVRIASSANITSTSLGVSIGAFEAPTAGVFPGTSPTFTPAMVTVMCRAAGNGNKLGYYTKIGATYGNGTSSTVTEAGATTPMSIERVFEIKRLAASGYVMTIYKADASTVVSNNTLALTATGSDALAATLTPTAPLVAGIALTGATAEIANVYLATLDTAGTPTELFSTPAVAASPVAATSVTVAGPSASTSYNNTFIAASAAPIPLSATVLPDDATVKTVTWVSSDATIASVDAAGLVTVHKVGDVTINATAADGSGVQSLVAFPISITAEANPVTSITVTGASSLMASLKASYAAAVQPSTATLRTVTWSTSDSSLATVDSSGMVTAVAAGTVDVIATATDGSLVSGKATITVTAFSATAFSWATGSGTDYNLGTPQVISGLNVVGRSAAATAVVLSSASGIVLSNNRFVVGSLSYDSATGGATLLATTSNTVTATTFTAGACPTDGQFNFTRTAKVTVTYSSYTPPSSGTNTFDVYIDNNGTSGTTTSPLVPVSKLTPTYSTGTSFTTTGGTVTYTIDPAAITTSVVTPVTTTNSTAGPAATALVSKLIQNAFLQFRTGGPPAGGTAPSITITGISVDYQ